MKKPYIKRYGIYSKYTIWIVDGEYIRNKINEEFTNYGQHYRFKFIPKNEFWIDKERVPGEEKYFIDNMLVQNRLMSGGVSYLKAVGKAEAAERKERRKHEFIKLNKKKSPNNSIIKKIHKRLLKKYSNKINVWIIDGELVRDLFYVDFTEGGHDKVYKFIPKNEIWIDDDLNLKELKFVLLHEIHERNLMSNGMDYDSAHKSSSELEHYCRKHPKSFEKLYKNELQKTK